MHPLASDTALGIAIEAISFEPMADKVMRDIEKLFSPDAMKAGLIRASLFLSAFELLKDAIVGQVKGFYAVGLVPQLETDYRTKVRKLHPQELAACGLWLQGNGVLTSDDLQFVDRVRTCRNDIAHELPKYLIDADFEIDVGLLQRMRDLIDRIDRWFITEVHIPSDPAFDNVEIDPQTIDSGRAMLLDIIIALSADAGRINSGTATQTAPPETAGASSGPETAV